MENTPKESAAGSACQKAAAEARTEALGAVRENQVALQKCSWSTPSLKNLNRTLYKPHAPPSVFSSHLWHVHATIHSLSPHTPLHAAAPICNFQECRRCESAQVLAVRCCAVHYVATMYNAVQVVSVSLRRIKMGDQSLDFRVQRFLACRARFSPESSARVTFAVNLTSTGDQFTSISIESPKKCAELHFWLRAKRLRLVGIVYANVSPTGKAFAVDGC